MAGKVLETCLMFVLDSLPSRRSFGVDRLRSRARSAHNKIIEPSFFDMLVARD
jgi:hypothetical protein